MRQEGKSIWIHVQVQITEWWLLISYSVARYKNNTCFTDQPTCQRVTCCLLLNDTFSKLKQISVMVMSLTWGYSDYICGWSSMNEMNGWNDTMSDVYFLPGILKCLPLVKPKLKYNISIDSARHYCSLHSRLNVCSSEKERNDRVCGNIGFKHWFRPEQTFYHSMHKIDLCEMTKIPLKTQSTAG